MNIQIEKKLIEKFIKKEKQERYLNFIKKSREKFLNQLFHFNDFDWRLFEEVDSNETEIVKQKLIIKKSITSCYVISTDQNFDGKIFLITEIIKHIGSFDGTIIIFGEAEIIYYEGEPPKNRFISK